jgi:signal transduction histidine kinase
VLASVEQHDARALPQLKNAIALAERTVRDTRLAVWNLRSSLDARSTLSELIALCAAERATPDTDVRFTSSGTAQDLSPSQRLAIVRIVQEAVTNAVRHGRARRIEIHLEYGAQHLRLTVSDDGSGFVAADPSFVAHGWGLHGMRERARALGGNVLLRSAPGAATTVILVLPHRGRRRRRKRREVSAQSSR